MEKQKNYKTEGATVSLRTVMVLLLMLLVYVPVAVAQSTEEEAIKKVVRAETEAFYARDAEAWKACWSQDAKATRALVLSNEYIATTGWENFGPAMIKDLQDNPNPHKVDVVNSNYIIRVSGDLAWVEFDQETKFKDSQETGKYLSREHRVLMRETDKWKIV